MERMPHGLEKATHFLWGLIFCKCGYYNICDGRNKEKGDDGRKNYF